MRKRSKFLSALAFSATVLLPFTAAAPATYASTTALLGASGFNVFTLSDFTATGTDAIGRVAVGGNFNPGNGTGSFTVASGSTDLSTMYDLVVNGNLYNSGTSMGGGSAWVGGNANWANFYIPGNLVVNGTFTDNGGGNVGGKVYSGTYAGPSYMSHAAITSAQQVNPVDFASALTQLPALSSQLSTAAVTGTIGKVVNGSNSGLTLTASGCTVCVFSLTAAELQNAMKNGGGGVNITAPSGATVLVDVNGATVNINGSSITINGTTRNEVLWNFYNATQINYQGVSWQGSILAPGANFAGINSYVSGNIEGQLVVKTDSAAVEIHNYLFDGNLPSSLYSTTTSATPEPSTWVLMLSGFAIAGFQLRKKVSSRQ